MTLAGMTPAEQVRALGLAVGDTIEGTENTAHKVRLKLIGTVNGNPVWEWWAQPKTLPDRWLPMDESRKWPLETVSDWRKISSDPTLDPCEPLRAELREAYSIIQSTMDNNWLMRVDPTAWLDKNAGFGPGKEGDES